MPFAAVNASSWISPLTIAFVAASLLAIWHKRFKYPSNLPPGPSRSLFGDNRRDIPSIHPWKMYTEWTKRYGDVISYRIGNTPVIVLNSFKAATDLLQRRGDIYSSRPRNIIGGEILSGGMRGIGMPYGPRWRNWRSLMHAGMSIGASKDYMALQSIESRILLRDLLQEKDINQFTNHLRRFIISTVFCVSYGRRIDTLDHEIIRANAEVDDDIISYNVPGKFLVDSWPILLYLPRALQWFRWVPEEKKARDTAFYLSLMESVRQRMHQGVAQPCTATRALEKQALFGMNDVETAYALSAPSQAGVGTTLAATRIFIMAMLLYPSSMKKVQEEIDRVVGPDRLPEFKDEESMPYIQAVINETLRWRPLIPASLPHSVIADDSYNGMFIPKGSTVIPNIDGMTQDPEMFPEPNVFRPERFLGTEDPNFVNYTISFGFGRRICPGMHIARQSLFIFIARVLWAFDIVPAKDASGNILLPNPDDFKNNLVISPQPFGYNLTPRRGTVENMIVADAELAEAEAKAWN